MGTYSRWFRGVVTNDLEQAWTTEQPSFVALRPDTPHLIATGSDHHGHGRQPGLVEAKADIVPGRSIRRAPKGIAGWTPFRAGTLAGLPPLLTASAASAYASIDDER